MLYEPVPSDGLVPKMYMLYRGNEPRRVTLQVTTLDQPTLVRFTGGCGNLPERRAAAMYELFVEGFRGYRGGLLFGGTRMLRMPGLTSVRHGITEVPPLIHLYNPSTMLIGVVPVEEPPLEIDIRLGHVISRDDEFVTIVHPGQDFYLLLQATPDDGVIWEAEYRFCMKFTQELCGWAGFSSLLVSYNGGNTTKKEIIETAMRGWPVLLIDESGGQTQRLARHKGFLADHPNVLVCTPRVDALREALGILGVLDIPGSAPVIPIRKEDPA